MSVFSGFLSVSTFDTLANRLNTYLDVPTHCTCDMFPNICHSPIKNPLHTVSMLLAHIFAYINYKNNSVFIKHDIHLNWNIKYRNFLKIFKVFGIQSDKNILIEDVTEITHSIQTICRPYCLQF